MPRSPRVDGPGTWHHVMNSGIAKRPIFESGTDIRAFLARLARVVREGRLEVHAYCVLTTHFHLLVRSPVGELSSAMQSLQNEYSRWFNRLRRRDGPLYRSRFRSKVVESLTYRHHLVDYIDANPVTAGLAAAPAVYPHCSARWYAQRRGPPWLCRVWVESCVSSAAGRDAYDPRDYARAFGGRVSPRVQRLIERRIALAAAGHDPLDDLLGAAPERVARWMRSKAALADGSEIGLPICEESAVDEVFARARGEQGEWPLQLSRATISGWPLAHVACLRDLCGASLSDVARRTGSTVSGAWSRYERHRVFVVADADYARRAAVLAQRALDTCHRGVGT